MSCRYSHVLVAATLFALLGMGDASPLQSDEAPPALPQTAASESTASQPPARGDRNLRPRVYKGTIEPHWIAGSSRFWYRNDLPGNAREFILVDAETRTRAPAFDHARLAEALSALIGKSVEADHLPVESLDFNRVNSDVRLISARQTWLLDPATDKVTEMKRGVQAQGEAGELPVAFGERPSIDGGIETEITFENLLCHDVQLFWIDTQGQRQPYALLIAGGRHQQHTYSGHVWSLASPGGDSLAVFTATREPSRAVAGAEVLSQLGKDPRERRPRRAPGSRGQQEQPATNVVRSPDGRWEAFVKSHNLWLRERATGAEHPLTTDATADDTYHRDAVRERAVGLNYTLPDFPDTLPEAIWSPDSTRLIALRTHTVPERKVYLVESSPQDQLQPKLHSYPYLKPGDPLPVSKPHLFTIDGFREIAVSDELFPAPWDIGDFRWSADSRSFTFLYNARGHQALRILNVDAASGAVRAIVDERSETFIDYSGKMFVESLDETRELIWMSERDGWNHLYLYSTAPDKAAPMNAGPQQITKGEWVVRGVDYVDRQRRQIWFRAGGVRAGQDPYYLHLCRVNFDGSGFVILTEGDGTHAVQWSPDRRFFVDTFSRVDLPPVIELRRGDDGSKVCDLETADAREVLATGRPLPERFAAKGRDGTTDIYGVIHRPRNLEANSKLPVIELIYAGPHSAHVPKAFQPSFNVNALCDEGFIVVQIDGMGTSQRSKTFHDVCWKNLGDAGFPDRIAWMKAAAAGHPELDLTRVGIYGGSAGGQNALRALLAHGDFYKAAAADCGCHDNRMDKAWWNEQWMGWPLGPHYVEQSNVTQAHRLQGKLLLVVGELDRNVDPASTMQVVNALIKADKDFDLLFVPGAGHGALGTPYATRRMHEFFKTHLK